MPQCNCPHCHALLEVTPDLAGATVGCPHCQQQLVVPQPAGGSAPARPLQMSRIVERRFQPATSLLDIFDFKFEKYVTPLIIRVTWVVVLLAATAWMLFIVVATIWSWLPESTPAGVPSGAPTVVFGPFGPDARPSPPSAEARWFQSQMLKTMAALSSLVLAGLTVLWIRVSLETVIVIFNIAKTLTSMDAKMKAP